MFEITEKEASLLKACGSLNPTESATAQAELTKAMAEEFVKSAFLDGDLISGLYTDVQLDEDVPAEFILDLIQPGTEREYIAYYLPDTGYVPERSVNMNKVLVPTIAVSSSINCPLKFLRQKRVDILGRMMEALEAGFVMRDNLEGFTVLMSAGSAHATVEASVTDGTFDLASLRAMKLAMRRANGGNSTSINRNKMTDMYLSPEASEDIRQLAHDVADDFTRKKIADLADMDGFLFQGVNFRIIDELGDGQLFQKVWTDVLGKTLSDNSTELLIGLNLAPSNKKNFVKPKRRGLEMYEDPTLHRRQEFGWYSWKERGFGILDTRGIIIGNA